jgi:excisionase family DNA binding protein
MGLQRQHTYLNAHDLSPREAAEQTGLSRTPIYRELERSYLRAYKVGGRLRISAEDLAEWTRLDAVVPRSDRGDVRARRAQRRLTQQRDLLVVPRTIRSESAPSESAP